MHKGRLYCIDTAARQCDKVAQYAIKGDPVYITKKGIYLIEAVIGLRNWSGLSKKNKNNE